MSTAGQWTERLRASQAGQGHPICLGIDPHAQHPPRFMQKTFAQHGVAKWLELFSGVAIEAAAGSIPMVKFQSAFYEAAGSEGYRILAESIKAARNRGLLVLLDAKRGDIASTMQAYGQSAFDALGADAVTVTPYLGFGWVKGWQPWLRAGRGVYVVWRTSNRDAMTIQDAQLDSQESVNELILREARAAFNDIDCTASLGLVLGLTRVEDADCADDGPLSSTPLLLPGYGPQGGAVSAALRTHAERSGLVTLPMSRHLMMLGDQQLAPVLAECSDWEHYGRLVAGRITDEIAAW